MGCEQLTREVFINSVIFIEILDVEIVMSSILILDNVCTLWAVTKANRVTSFFDTASSDRFSCGKRFSKNVNTIDGSQVVSYLGTGGRDLNMPLKKRFIF